MLKATKIRLKPTKEQEALLCQQFGACRFVWNLALEIKSTVWQRDGESLSCYKIKTFLPMWKRVFPWLKNVDSQALQQVVLNLDRSFKSFFSRKHKYPKFKSKNSKQSYQYPQRVKIQDNSLYLPKVGWVRGVIHRKITGTIKTVTISKTATGKVYASVLTDDGKALPAPKKHVKTVLGVDFGIKHLLTCSDGKTYENPRILQKHLANLKRKQKKLSRKQKGSKNRSKARLLIAKAHEKVRLCREDLQHKISRTLADENQAVGVESLCVKGMLQNKQLSRSLADVGFASLLAKLEYKLKEQGHVLLKVGRFFPSSKTCHCCGCVNKELKLKDRYWACKACGVFHDRDLNAAINIKKEATLMLKADGYTVSACGGKVSPVKALALA